jgi:phenylalanyl-tRNA synthetase beta chain
MKLPLLLLQKYVDLSSQPFKVLVATLDELGVEVKNFEGDEQSCIFTLETLANRSDHLSAVGIAREVAARLHLPLKAPLLATNLSDRNASIPVKNLSSLCSRYALLDISLPPEFKLRDECKSPLLKGGDKPALVELLSFVQLELGQPMHAFDRDKIQGTLFIDELASSESILALDGKEYKVPQGALVIRDSVKIVAVAGIIGCANSMVDSSSTRILIESATFDPVSVRLTRRAMGVVTDAAAYFERSADREGVLPALRRVVYLGTQGVTFALKESGFTYIEGPPAERRKILVSLATIRHHLNTPRLAEIEILSKVKALGYICEDLLKEKSFSVIVPSWRLGDVKEECDIVEDVVRHLGFGKVKSQTVKIDPFLPEVSQKDDIINCCEDVLVGKGFQEVITSVFLSERDIVTATTPPGTSVVRIKNALESNNAGLRTTLLLHLGDVLNRNSGYGVERLAVYERATVFGVPYFGGPDLRARAEEKGVEEVESSVLCLAYVHSNSKVKEHQALFTKGVVEDILEAARVKVHVAKSSYPILHPGIQGALISRNVVVGAFGEVHPSIVRERGWKVSPFYVELFIDELKPSGASKDRAVSHFPEVWRDLTLGLPVNDLSHRIVDILIAQKVPDLAKVEITSHFRKDEESFRRVTYRLVFQSMTRSLSNEEVSESVAAILERLKEKHKVTLVV